MNWKYKNKEIKTISDFPEKAIGFVYLITNLDTGFKYYGRKTCRSLNKKKKLTKKEKALPENSRKTYKYVEHEYKGWQNYNGSCEPLLNDIKNGARIKKEIVRFCNTKKSITAWELKYITCDCILEDKCYNGNILGKIFKNDFND